jgi:hypothetical protein
MDCEQLCSVSSVAGPKRRVTQVKAIRILSIGPTW